MRYLLFSFNELLMMSMEGQNVNFNANIISGKCRLQIVCENIRSRRKRSHTDWRHIQLKIKDIAGKIYDKNYDIYWGKYIASVEKTVYEYRKNACEKFVLVTKLMPRNKISANVTGIFLLCNKKKYHAFFIK